MKTKKVKKKKNNFDKHLGCPSYPMCDEAPLGCCHLTNNNPEWFGHKD
jgi:hypothetical protein